MTTQESCCVADILRILGESRARIHIPLCPSLRRDQFSFSYDEPARSAAMVNSASFCVRTGCLVLQDTDIIEDNAYSSDDVLTDDEVEQRVTRQAVLYEDVIEREINEGGYSAGALIVRLDALRARCSFADVDENDLIDIATEESVGQSSEKTLTPMKTPDKGPGKPTKLLGSGQKMR